MAATPATIIRPAAFEMPHRELVWNGLRPTWQSNGGAFRGHPARSYPFSLRFPVPKQAGLLTRIDLVGVLAFHADRLTEATGTLGAVLQIGDDKEPLTRFELINGIHYSDCLHLAPVERENGDGSTVCTLGIGLLEDQEVRIDRLSIDIPRGAAPSTAIFRDLGSPASFALIGVEFAYEPVAACPFKAAGGGIPLSEIPAILRLGDRVRFDLALEQAARSVAASSDIDEARGEALTFLAVLAAATIELGAPRTAHRFQLDAARALERHTSTQQIAREVRERAEVVCEGIFKGRDAPSSESIDEALAMLQRYFARDLTDAEVAAEVGLSTSHFRHVFKEATGQPFHKYLMNLRLEKARSLLLEQGLSVAQVAEAVGFTSLPHFSRAFSQRFSVTPSRLRRGAA